MQSDLIILAGGLGTRLRHLLDNVPKPMAPVNDQPFLAYIFNYLKNQDCKRVILSVGHLNESIKTYFGHEYLGIEIVYAIENTPLGTGGAIRLAMEQVQTNAAFIMNGDTFFNIDLLAMEGQHFFNKNELTIAIKEMHEFDRYGTVNISDDRIVSFEEKKPLETGYINAGTYLLNKNEFLKINWPEKFSFEKDFLEKYTAAIKMIPFYSDGYFIDIGVPEDYRKVQRDFKTLFP